MNKSLRLRDRVKIVIQQWYDARGCGLVICIREFCQGNRTSLTPILDMAHELACLVFQGDGAWLNDDLVEDLEYGVFELIGRFSETPGGEELLRNIETNLVEYLTDIFTETKKQWNLNQYKIAASFEEIDPRNDIIPDRSIILAETVPDPKHEAPVSVSSCQARDILDELVIYARSSFRGELKRKIAVKWLENPERGKDFTWLAALAGTTPGCAKVILTRIKHSLAKAYHLRRESDRLILTQVQKL